MKTIILCSNTAWSLYNFRSGLIKELLNNKYRVVAVVPEDSFSARLTAMGCEVFNIRIDNKGTNPWRDIKTLLGYHIFYRRIRPDVIFHFTIKPVIYGSLAARWAGIPCINMITGLGTAFNNESLLTKLIEFLYRISQRWPHKIIFQNQDDMQLFLSRKLVSADQTLRVPGSGVDLSAFKPGKGHNRKNPVFILFARLLWYKGIGVYADAARKVKITNPDVKFQLLGQFGIDSKTSIPKAQVDAWVNEGIIDYLGETDDVRPYIENSDCVVLPSYYREGVPHSLLEAAAMARPIITTDNVGCRDAVDDGATGLLCKVKDADDLADKMKKFIGLSARTRDAMGKNGRKKMESQFDEKIIIKTYMDLIKKILKVKK